MQNKGFGTVEKPLLIKGWLIKENREYCNLKKQTIVVKSLQMTINMWLAMASERYADKDMIQNAEFSLDMLATIDKALLQDSQADGIWYRKIKNDDAYYIEYYRHLLALVKEAIASGKQSELNGCIQNTWEYSEWMQEAGHLLVTQKLVDDWRHPLAEISDVNGKEAMNLWMFASMICGGVCDRLLEVNKEKCVNLLDEMNIDSRTGLLADRLVVCKHIDAEYLNLVNEVKEALETKFDTAFDGFK